MVVTDPYGERILPTGRSRSFTDAVLSSNRRVGTMDWQEINRDEIERRRDRLFDRFGNVPVRQRHDTPSPDRFEEWIELSKMGYIGSAYALIRRSPADLPPLTESMAVDGEERERVLLIIGRGGSK